MKDRFDALICERGDDLISFLYHELNEREVRDFEQHLAICSSCNDELASFKDIRASVVAWREQTLGLSPIVATDRLALSQTRKPSALAAMRQFFALSPVWLKGAVAFASILFVAAMAFLVMNLRTNPSVPMVASDKRYSEDELKTKIEEGIQIRLKELNSSTAPPRQVVAQAPELRQSPKPKLKPATAVGNTRRGRAPLTRSERQQLAADLRLISPNDDSDLQLWSEQINR